MGQGAMHELPLTKLSSEPTIIVAPTTCTVLGFCSRPAVRPVWHVVHAGAVQVHFMCI